MADVLDPPRHTDNFVVLLEWARSAYESCEVIAIFTGTDAKSRAEAYADQVAVALAATLNVYRLTAAEGYTGGLDESAWDVDVLVRPVREADTDPDRKLGPLDMDYGAAVYSSQENRT